TDKYINCQSVVNYNKCLMRTLNYNHRSSIRRKTICKNDKGCT
ncbi:hypothetical protein GBAR_LOCUS19063, partial [Geodia barretti]